MVGALLDGIEGKPCVLDVDAFFVERVHQVVFHCTMQEDLLPYQGFLHHCPDDLSALTLLPIEGFRSTCIELFPKLFVGGVQNSFVLHHRCKLFGNGNHRRSGTKKPSVSQDVDEDWEW